MNNRLKIISIAVGIVYILTIGNTIYHEMADAVHGFKQGVKEGASSRRTGEMPSISSLGTFFLYVKPEQGLRTFPNSMLNHADGQPMKAEYEKIVVELPGVKGKLSAGRIFTDIFSALLSFYVLFVMILIPVQTFRIVRSVAGNKIFDPGNIRKMRMIGYALLSYYVAGLVLTFFHYRAATGIVSLDGYALRMDWGNTTFVLLGLVVLMFAEVLKVSVQLKEEQDLTV